MITITERAAREALRILEEQQKPEAMVRIWIAGVGCGGYRYGLGIDERSPEQGDEVFTQDGVRVVVDAGSLEHLAGAKLDWIDDPAAQGFSIDNPNPAPEGGDCSSECGGSCCGTEDSAEPAT
jgi:iron-sulfur cluster assembly protein